MLGTTRRGPLSNNRKNRLDPVKIKTKGQLSAKPRPCPRPPTLHLARGLARKASHGLPNFRLARGLAREASDNLPIFRLARGLARKASDGEPILRLARGPTHKASDEMSILRLARGRLGNNPSPLPRPVSLTERRVPLMHQPLLRYQLDDDSTLQSGRRDG